MTELKKALDRIVNWLQVHYPEVTFRPGLTENEIKKLTQDFSFKLPKEVVELYQCYDGCSPISPYSFVFYSLEEAMKVSNSFQWRCEGENIYRFPIFTGGKDFYYILCDEQKKESCPVWCQFVGLEPDLYSTSVTTLILFIAECYETGAYYVILDEESGYLELEQDLDKEELIFQKYNPEQIQTWREIWRN